MDTISEMAERAFASRLKCPIECLLKDIPLYTSIHANVKNFSCTCFSACGGDIRLLGRNYDWPEQSTYFILFAKPPNG